MLLLLACVDARVALAANQPCFNAVRDLDINNYTIINREELDVYCSPDCRNLNDRVLTTCSDPDNPQANADITEIVCPTDDTGGTKGLMTSGSVLLIAAIIVTVLLKSLYS